MTPASVFYLLLYGDSGGQHFCDGATVRRFPLHKSPNIVLLGGVFLSILFATLSSRINNVSAVDSVILGLIGTVLSVQFEVLVRHEEHYEFAELLAGPRWLHECVKNLAVDGAIIATRFHDTPVEDEARDMLRRFRVELGDLCLGRLRRSSEDPHYLHQYTRDAKSRILGVTVIGQGIGNPGWWRTELGQSYLEANAAAVHRNVLVKRVIIYSKDQQEEALELARDQHEAGIKVRLALRETLQREQRINFAVWDERISWEAQMNAEGNQIAGIYCVEPAGIRRLVEMHRALWANSTGYTP